MDRITAGWRPGRRRAVLGAAAGLGAALALRPAGAAARRAAPERLVVTGFGTAGDGVADDTAALRAAVSALAASPARPRSLVFPAGRTFRIATPGAHGLHLRQLSGVRIVFEPGAMLLIDNLRHGMATGHGILVEGPCEDVEIAGAHVAYARMSAARQGWAPFYVLGAQVGRGDAQGWFRGRRNAEDAAAIARGACRDIRLLDCRAENSPSVMAGLVGVDGSLVRGFRGRRSWADGLYHVFVRGAVVTDAVLEEVGDDGVSLASYESGGAMADVEAPFHAEGSRVSGVTLRGQYPAFGVQPSAGVALLGVRDVEVTGVRVADHHTALRFETGRSTGRGGNPEPPALNLSFLGCRRIRVRDLAASGVAQGLKWVNKEVSLSAEPKWWRHEEVSITGVRLEAAPGLPAAASSAFDVAGIYGGDAVLAGTRLTDVSALGFRNPHATLGPLLGCGIEDVALDGRLTLSGLRGRPRPGAVPDGAAVGVDAEGMMPGGVPVPEASLQLRGLQAEGVVLLGLEGGRLADLGSAVAEGVALQLSDCAALAFGTVRLEVTGGGRSGPVALAADRRCRRIRVDRLLVHQAGQGAAPLLALGPDEDIAIGALELHGPVGPRAAAADGRATRGGLARQVEPMQVVSLRDCAPAP